MLQVHKLSKEEAFVNESTWPLKVEDSD